MNPLCFLATLSALTLPQQTRDPAAIAAKVQEKLKAAASLSLEAEMRGPSGPPLKFKVRALRPNYYRVEGERQSFYSDGQAAWQYFPLQGQYGPFHRDESGMMVPMAQGFETFSPTPQYKSNYERAEETTFEGKKVIALIREPKEVPTLRLSVMVDPETWLPVGQEQTMNGKSNVLVYRNVRTDEKLTPKDFAWSPPKGAIDMRTIKQDGPKPLQPGEYAPGLPLKLMNGRTPSLQDLRKGKKALLVNYWFINCGYCLMELPELAALYKELKDQGLEMVAVNDADTTEEIRSFLRKAKYTFPVAMDPDAASSKAFRIQNYGRPITFLIDADGKIAYTQVGYDTAKKLTDLREALAKLGLGGKKG